MVVVMFSACGGTDSSPRTVVPAGSTFVAAKSDEPPRIREWVHVDDLPEPLARFETVFWDPRDTISLRELIRETDTVRGKNVLEIGCGTGLLSLCCLQAGAERVVATDINPAAVANARYNAERLGFGDRLDVRLVSRDDPTAFSTLRDDERFDVIVSNPPWEESTPDTIDDFALYDDGFQLLRSLVDGLPERLTPGGRALLAYGCTTAIRELERETARRGANGATLAFRQHDDRSLDSLPETFLPGMMIEISQEPSETDAPADP